MKAAKMVWPVHDPMPLKWLWQFKQSDLKWLNVLNRSWLNVLNRFR